MKNFSQVLSCFVDGELPLFLDKINVSRDLNSEEFTTLQNFIQLNIKEHINWARSVGIIKSTDYIINYAMNNKNIRNNNLTETDLSKFRYCQFCGCCTSSKNRICCNDGYKEDKG